MGNPEYYYYSLSSGSQWPRRAIPSSTQGSSAGPGRGCRCPVVLASSLGSSGDKNNRQTGCGRHPFRPGLWRRSSSARMSSVFNTFNGRGVAAAESSNSRQPQDGSGEATTHSDIGPSNPEGTASRRPAHSIPCLRQKRWSYQHSLNSLHWTLQSHRETANLFQGQHPWPWRGVCRPCSNQAGLCGSIG